MRFPLLKVSLPSLLPSPLLGSKTCSWIPLAVHPAISLSSWDNTARSWGHSQALLSATLLAGKTKSGVGAPQGLRTLPFQALESEEPGLEL